MEKTIKMRENCVLKEDTYISSYSSEIRETSRNGPTFVYRVEPSMDSKEPRVVIVITREN